MKSPKQIALTGLSVLVAIAATSCSDRGEDLYLAEDEMLSEEQIEKIAYGCSSYTDNEDCEKIETDASDEYMAVLEQRLEAEREASHNKAIAGVQYVGVVKDKTCGKYDEARIYYDCQDHSANDTYWHGYKGSWTVTQNITMRFCLVPAELFKNTKDNYAVMNFSPSDHFQNDDRFARVGRIDGLMDAEDSKCKSAIYYTEYGKKEVKDVYNLYTNNTKLTGNGNLQYQMFYFTPQGGGNGYPDLGFDYGVFGMFNFTGKFDDNQGVVHSDDEDSSNANIATYTYEKTENKSFKGSCHRGIIRVNRNTDFYIAKISTKK